MGQSGNPLIEGTQLEAMTFGIGRAFEAALAPGSDVVTPGWMWTGRHGRLGWPRLCGWLSGLVRGRCHNTDVVTIADHLAGAWRGACLGGKAAHLALDHTRVVPSPALLDQIGPAAAQHQPLTGQGNLQFGEDAFAL